MNTQYSKENILRELSEEKTEYYYVVFNDEIIGNFRIIWDENLEGLPEGKQVKLHRIYLHQKIQGKGIGKNIVSWLENKAKAKGYKIISGGTDNHCMLIDLRNKGISGKDAEVALGKADITVNKNMVPCDDKSPFVTSGIRVGTPAITTRGLKVEDMKQVVNFIDEAIQNADNEEALHEIGERVSEMMSSRRLFVM